MPVGRNAGSMSLLDFFETQRPAPKRVKRTDSETEMSQVAQTHPESVADSDLEDDSERSRSTPLLGSETIISAADGSEDVHHPTSSQTELETSLPPVKADKEAIEEYEASRAAEEDPSLEEKLGKRKWRQGKSSIYVDAFNLALETVLDEEAHLFNEAEMEVFRAWRSLTYESQYLYVSLTQTFQSDGERC
jgi:Fanconi-associated nuclease 1